MTTTYPCSSQAAATALAAGGQHPNTVLDPPPPRAEPLPYGVSVIVDDKTTGTVVREPVAGSWCVLVRLVLLLLPTPTATRARATADGAWLDDSRPCWT